MKTIYCIALEGEGATGVDWFYQADKREDAAGTTGATEEVMFEIEVPEHATHAEITELADAAAWEKSYRDAPAASTLTYGHNGFALRSAAAQAVEPSAWTAEALASAQVRVDFGHVEPDYHYDMLDEWHACCRRHGVSDAVGNAGLKSIRTYLRAQESSLVASPA